MSKAKVPNSSRPDDENPEWTAEDFARARSAAEVLPEYIAYYRLSTTPRRRAHRHGTAEGVTERHALRPLEAPKWFRRTEVE